MFYIIIILYLQNINIKYLYFTTIIKKIRGLSPSASPFGPLYVSLPPLPLPPTSRTRVAPLSPSPGCLLWISLGGARWHPGILSATFCHLWWDSSPAKPHCLSNVRVHRKMTTFALSLGSPWLTPSMLLCHALCPISFWDKKSLPIWVPGPLCPACFTSAEATWLIYLWWSDAWNFGL